MDTCRTALTFALGFFFAGADQVEAQTDLPVISISPTRMAEGQSDSTPLLVPVFLSGPSPTVVTVNWTVTGGTAEAGTDFTPASGTISFAPGEIYQSLPLQIQGDTTDEFDETIALLLSTPSGAVLGTDSTEVRIENDEKVTTVSLPSNAAMMEKDHPAASLPAVTVGNPQAGRTVGFGVTGGTATPGDDFAVSSSILELSAASISLSLSPVDDASNEPDETVQFSLTNPGPAVAFIPGAPIQTLPAVPMPKSIAVDAEVMATADADQLRIFRKQAGLWMEEATIPATADGGVFSVAVDHGLVAADFADSGVRIYARAGDGVWTLQALIPRGTAPIDNRRVLAMRDEVLLIGGPAAAGQDSISGEVRVHERHAGGPGAWGLSTVLHPVATQPDFGASLAIHGKYLAAGAPGSYSVTLFEQNPATHKCSVIKEHIRIFPDFGRSFALNGDMLVMPIRTVFFTSRRPTTPGAAWSDAVQQQIGPVISASPRVSFQNGLLWAYYSNQGLRSYTVRSNELWATSGPLPLPVASLSANLRFAVSDQDIIVTGTESEGLAPLLVHSTATAQATIVDDESLVITIGSLSANGGMASIPVQLSKALPVSLSVDCVTLDGTATGGDDYTATNSPFTFPAGATIAYLGVAITAPEVGEPVEQFQIKLQNPSLGTVGPNATITIMPTFPSVSFSNSFQEFAEGDSGTTSINFLVNLSGPAPDGATFDWATEDGGAVSGTDFPAASGTVSVPAGAITASITCVFNGDTVAEGSEAFLIRITGTHLLKTGSPTSINVTLNNDDIGTLVGDHYTLPQNTALSGVNVRANDTGVDLIQLKDFPMNGGLVPTITGAFVYTPNVNFIGTDSFTYSNYYGISGNTPVTTTATIIVTDANVPPLLKPDNYTTREDTLLDVTTGFPAGLLANDGLLNTSGEAFDPILAKEILEVTNGTVTNFSGNGLFKFMPAPNFGGIAGFSYRVRDKDGWSIPATVRITVTDDLALPPLQRLNPNGSQLFRSYLSGVSLPATGELDWAVKLKAGQTISLRAGTTGSLGILAVRDSNGIALTGGVAGVNSLEHVPVPADGTYLIAAGQRVGGSSGSFMVLVNGGIAPATTTAAAPYNLDAGQPVGSPLAAVAAVMPNTLAPHYFSLAGTAGETIRLYLHSSLPQSFSLQTDTGTILAGSTVSPHQPTASLLQHTFTATGSYRLVVAGVRLAEYSLQLTRRGLNLEYSTATLPLLEKSGFGYLAGPGIAAQNPTDPVTTFATFADYGQNTTGERDVSIMVKSWNPDFIAIGGDHNYATDYTIGAPTWTSHVGNYYGSFMKGRVDNRYPEQTSLIQRFFPAPGNHDSGPDVGNGGELSGYFDYLYANPGGPPRLPAGVHQPMLNYYKMSWANTEFYFLDSDNAAVSTSARALQRQWLKDQLAVSTAQWKFGVWHHPPYSSGGVHGSQAFMQWGQDFAGLTAIFTGHDHTYERLDAGYGVTQFVVGLGGAGPYSFSNPLSNTLSRYNAKHGALKVVAGTTGVLFEFRSIGAPGGELIDSYRIGTVDGPVVPSGADTWSLRVQPGQVFRLTTRTPGSPGILTNDLNPFLQVFDAGGTLVATDQDGASDALNASVICTVPAIPGAPPEGVVWTIKIGNQSNGLGEYELEITEPEAADYQAWATALLPEEAQGHQADPDNDGVPNLMEFLLDSNPIVKNESAPLDIPGSVSAGIHLNLPSSWTRPVTVHLQSSASMAAGSWVTEASKSSVGGWTSEGPGTPQPAPEGGFNFPIGTGLRGFYRLWLTLN
ncbi:MAG: Calx-beta domain-containing protein [Verrucomicrobiota bacterium]